VIYAAFTVWLVLTIFAGIGVYRIWASFGKGQWVNWALLPGTLVSEMAYIFGSLITGGEIKKAKLVPDRADKGDGQPTTTATPRLQFVGPIVASLMSLVACGAVILIVHALLGEPVMARFLDEEFVSQVSLSKELPETWDALWDEVDKQVEILRRMCETWGSVDWLNWRVVLFVYLAACLAVRLGPVSRPIRATLGAVAAVAGVIALIGFIHKPFESVIHDIWPLMTYVWASLLLLLTGTLAVLGLMGLWRVITGKDAPGK